MKRTVITSYLMGILLGVGSWSSIAAAGPSEIRGESHAPPRSKVEATWEKVTTKVKEWWENRRGEAEVESDSLAIQQQEIRESSQELSQQKPTQVVAPGQPGDPSLRRNQAGVPIYPVFERREVEKEDGSKEVVRVPISVIPRLNVGRESRISSSDFVLPQLKVGALREREMQKLPTPDLLTDDYIARWTQKSIPEVYPKKDLPDVRVGLGRMVTRQDIDQIAYELTPAKDVIEKPFKELTRSQLEMLAALILFNRGDKCPTVIGLFDHLSKNKNLAIEANFHLGVCADRLNLNHTAFKRLIPVIRSEDKDFTSEAIKVLAQSVPRDLESEFSEMIRALRDPSLIPSQVQDLVNFRVGRGAFSSGNYKVALDYVMRVGESHSRYGEAQYIAGVSLYLLEDREHAWQTLVNLRAWLERQGTNENLNSLSAISLARMAFNRGDFKQAYDYYMAIDKSHPVWIQGLVEQGWTQLALDDYSGAIGNMYSLHSPYFQTVYKPESFVVRAIGYLNICQYGDAYKMLSQIESEYRPWHDQADAYIKETKLTEQYYQTVRNYLRGPSQADVDGLPHQLLREMGRQRDFLNVQTWINLRDDEVQRFIGVNEMIIQEKERIRRRQVRAQERLGELRESLEQSQGDSALARFIDQWQAQMRLERELIIGYRYQLAILEQGRQGYREFRQKSLESLAGDNQRLRTEAGKLLAAHLKSIRNEIATVIDNNEFLRYEVFAGSGENIRYQVAGGQVRGEAGRIPASVKPQRIMNWNFKGEFWLDEIGSYRSSLQNNCPSEVGL